MSGGASAQCDITHAFAKRSSDCCASKSTSCSGRRSGVMRCSCIAATVASAYAVRTLGVRWTSQGYGSACRKAARRRAAFLKLQPLQSRADCGAASFCKRAGRCAESRVFSGLQLPSKEPLISLAAATLYHHQDCQDGVTGAAGQLGSALLQLRELREV